MSLRQFYICIGILILVGFVIGPTSYFIYQASLKNQETTLLKEKERTSRSKNRWEKADTMWKRLPFVD
jgi:hypothetical protein